MTKSSPFLDPGQRTSQNTLAIAVLSRDGFEPIILEEGTTLCDSDLIITSVHPALIRISSPSNLIDPNISTDFDITEVLNWSRSSTGWENMLLTQPPTKNVHLFTRLLWEYLPDTIFDGDLDEDKEKKAFDSHDVAIHDENGVKRM